MAGIPRSEASPAVMKAARACADAVIALCLRSGDPDGTAAHLAARAAAALARSAEYLRGLEFDEAVIEAERERAAEQALAAAGLVPAPRGRHLHAVS